MKYAGKRALRAGVARMCDLAHSDCQHWVHQIRHKRQNTHFREEEEDSNNSCANAHPESLHTVQLRGAGVTYMIQKTKTSMHPQFDRKWGRITFTSLNLCFCPLVANTCFVCLFFLKTLLLFLFFI